MVREPRCGRIRPFLHHPGDEAEALVDIEPFHGALGAPVAPTRFAQDSLQEGAGFEPSVPFVDWGVSGFSRLTDRCAARLDMDILDEPPTVSATTPRARANISGSSSTAMATCTSCSSAPTSSRRRTRSSPISTGKPSRMLVGPLSPPCFFLLSQRHESAEIVDAAAV